MGNYIYFYFVRFSVQLFITVGFFACVLPRRRHFWARLLPMLAGYFTAGYGYIKLVNLIPDQFYPLSIFYYIILFGVTLAIVYGCFKAELWEVLFMGTAGYAVQHMTYAAVAALKHFIRRNWGADAIPKAVDEVVLHLVVYVLVGYVCYRLLARPNTERGELKRADPRMVILSLTVLLSSVVFSVFLDFQTSSTTLIICRLYAVIACALGLFMQFNISRGNQLEHDNEMLEYMLHLEKQQHEMARENIDIINIKCHDLKYQIAALEDMDNREQRRKSIEELERSVMIYDSMVQSGNDAFDLILTEKSLICKKYHIKFSYIVDGEKLNFMEVSDIYSLFGNALDNAIESVIPAAEERRIISLRVVSEGEMLHIHLENYCAKPPAFEDGLPVTTKEDKGFHGFGTRSIRYIIGRYGGDLRMSVSEERFSLDILFSLS